MSSYSVLISYFILAVYCDIALNLSALSTLHIFQRFHNYFYSLIIKSNSSITDIKHIDCLKISDQNSITLYQAKDLFSKSFDKCRFVAFTIVTGSPATSLAGRVNC